MCNTDFSRLPAEPTNSDAYNPYLPCPNCGKAYMYHDNPYQCTEPKK